MVYLYFHTNDPSKRKAIRWFNDHQIPITQRNIEKQPLTAEEVLHLLSISLNGTDDLISLRSRDTKALGMDRPSVTINEFTSAVQKSPRILKNPIIFDTNKLITGFDQEKMGIFIPQSQRRNELIQLMNRFTHPQGHIKLA
ncbi:ArsC/Spx/MgsR family protein [Limosilactobacillus caecicola]|uniref:ArsC/Spx/MgsR family protein n=1 Tax=Limosilactobacillus caecicola TaxID=2941332 RepID=UPI002041D4CB|nr:ArsC/Spx/MgsR family protein [Limosilactobacillus caecicola]